MASKRTDLLWVDPVNLTVQEGFNVRYDYGDIDELAKSIIENGVKVPVRGVKDRGTDNYILTDGKYAKHFIKSSAGTADSEVHASKCGFASYSTQTLFSLIVACL